MASAAAADGRLEPTDRTMALLTLRTAYQQRGSAPPYHQEDMDLGDMARGDGIRRNIATVSAEERQALEW